ncbi:hypothetical protein BLS_007899 [Venturia inaequalis]|uniref:F-box domain-containing protein n=1 Tax=Venturia inaequalis TaxID=5025 RepID=A0A8H3U7H0_VENIN|nr:hypothetical protein BLS_007899 [Venturia inaequalis]KAE9990801.1 hypothetical protein EG327_000948 [Venturia inaequalis]
MEAPAYPPRRNSSQIANGINRNDHSPTKGVFNNAKATSTSSGALSNEATHGRGSSIHDRTGPSGRKSVSPAFVVGKENPSEREIPSSYIYSTSPVPIQGDYKRMKQLPLALILMIVGFLDDVGDIARVTRASKLLYYLTLPKLYERVTLHSYPEIRYKDGRAEGFGSGSPFSMALDGLVSRNIGSYVRDLRLEGSWKEVGLEDFEKGRVPDNSMMLNIVVKAALDKMEKLESFCWKLSSKPLRTIYQGLGSRTTLQSLTIRFPSNRIPRPTVLMPGIPTLKSLHLLNIDPLCYPDDPSILLLQSKKLSSLKLEWSPRMRREKEPSISLQQFFSRCVRANYKIPLKHYGMKNLYCRKDAEMDQAFDTMQLESVHFINCVDPTDQATVFIDRTWMLENTSTENTMRNMKELKIDRLDVHNGQPFGVFEGFEGIYLVSPEGPLKALGQLSGTPTPSTPSASASPTPSTPSASEYSRTMVASGSSYIATITSRHGPSLKKLLLSDLWALSASVVLSVVEACPNLEQLGLCIENNDVDVLRQSMPFLKNLKALRILVREENETYRKIEEMGDEWHCYIMGQKCAQKEFLGLRWLGIGPRIYELREVVEEEGKGPRRVVRPASLEDVKHIEIWALDNLDL